MGGPVATSYGQRAFCESQLKEDDLALADYNRSLELDKNYAGSLAGRCGLYYRRKQYDLALRDCNAAIGVDANYWPPYLNRAVVRRALGDQAGAAEDESIGKRLQRTQ